MLSGRNFRAAVLLGALGIALGAAYPKLEDGLLPAWSFLSMEKEAFYSETVCFFVPLAAVLPWSDSFLGEWKGGFLKAVLPRTGRLDYVGNKVVTVMVSGFLAWLLAGILVLFGYFVVFFPLEKQGDFPLEEGISFVCVLLRLGFLGGILSTFGGMAAVVYRSVYMAWGLPFVAYYFCMILHDRILNRLSGFILPGGSREAVTGEKKNWDCGCFCCFFYWEVWQFMGWCCIGGQRKSDK